MRITVAEVLAEGNWSAAPWSPRVADDTAFQALVLELAGRAAAHVKWRVGETHYADITEPKTSILKAAEMHLCQAFLLEAAALVADGAAVAANPPVFAAGADLRAQAVHRRQLADELLAPLEERMGARIQRPVARTGSGSAPAADHPFDETTGRA